MKPAAPSTRETVPGSEARELLHLARENLALLTGLAGHYELARLGPLTERRAIRSPADVAAYLSPEMADLAQEQLRALLLNTRHEVLATQLVYQGGANAINIRLADCFREAVRLGAVALILVHNHPSGCSEPSPEDLTVSRQARTVGDLLGIAVLDHVILGHRDGHTSLRERGLFA